MLFAITVFSYNYFVPVTTWVYLATFLPFLAATFVIIYVYTRTWSLDGAAQISDKALNNYDKFSTALECIRSKKLNDVEKELLERTQFEVASVDVKKVVTVQATWETKSLAALLPVFSILVAVFFYYQIIAALTPLIQQSLLSAPVSKIEQAVNKLAASNSPEKKDIAKKLQALLKKLKGAKDIDNMLGQAQKLLQQLKKTETDPDVKKTLDSLGKAADFLSRSKMTRQLSEALKNGDMSKASSLMSNLSSKLQNMSGLTSNDLKKLGQNFQKSAETMKKSGST